eukprot:5681836-Alexandrium_andersonii.AAC.1
MRAGGTPRKGRGGGQPSALLGASPEPAPGAGAGSGGRRRPRGPRRFPSRRSSSSSSLLRRQALPE